MNRALKIMIVLIIIFVLLAAAVTGTAYVINRRMIDRGVAETVTVQDSGKIKVSEEEKARIRDLDPECAIVLGAASDQQQPYPHQAARNQREILARVKDYFMLMIKPKPKYLGETFPITGGSGEETHGE